VRNVEFYLDGQKVHTDGNYHFDHRFITPRLAVQPAFTLRARASDTGGNFTFTDEIRVTLVPDATAPFVTSLTPPDDAAVFALAVISATFDAPLDQTTLAGAFTLFAAGADGQTGTVDDQEITGGTLSYNPDTNTAFLSFPGPLPVDTYRAVLGSGLRDAAGNALEQAFFWTFTEFSDNELPPLTNKIWLGQTGPDWRDGANWAPAGVPDNRSNIFVPANTPSQLVLSANASTRNLFVDDGAQLDTAGFILATTGDVHVGGSITGAGTLEMSGNRKTLSGTVPGLRVTGAIALTGPTTVTGDLQVRDGSGRLRVNGQAVTVEGNFTANFNGGLAMLEDDDMVAIGGNATFGGASDDGLLNTGTLSIAGNLTQSGGSGTFEASGTHRTVFNGTAAQAISFSDPGPNRGDSHFQNLDIVTGAQVQFVTDTHVRGQLTVQVAAELSQPANRFTTFASALPIIGGIATLPEMRIETALVLTEDVDLPGADNRLAVRGVDASLNLNGMALTLEGHFIKHFRGALIMQDPNSRLTVGGDATFDASAEDGLMNAGILSVAGGFIQSGGGGTFEASGTHRTVLNGTSNQAVSFSDPGNRDSDSHFFDLEITNPVGVTFSNNAFANGRLIVGNETSPTLSATGSRLTVTGVDVDGMTLDNLPLTIDGGMVTRFDNVTLGGFNPTVIQLTINHPELNATFTGLNFEVEPTGAGRYIHATDSDGQAPTATLTLIDATPEGGSADSSTSGGFVLNW